MIRDIGKIVAGAFFHSGIPGLVRRLPPPRLTVLAYHRIRESEKTGSEFDDHVFGPTAAQFRAQMEWLRESSTPLSQDDVLAILRGEREVPPRAVMVTFDDGYLDNYELAFPILRELGIPAIFFVPTRSIEWRELGWWDLVAYFAKRTTLAQISFHDETLKVDGNRAKLITHFQSGIKNGRYALTGDFLEQLSVAFGVDFPDHARQGAELMSWDQLRRLNQGPFAVGSHTHRHPILGQLPLPEQRDELARSKALLEERLGGTIRSLAYPVGGYGHFQPQTKHLAAECGYELAFSFQTGVNESTTFDPFDIRRIHPPRQVAVMGTALAFPSLYQAYRSRNHEALSVA